MNIIPFIENLEKDFNKIFETFTNILTFERLFYNFSNDYIKKLFSLTIESIDEKFMLSKERKEKYYVKEIVSRTIITCFGEVNYKSRIYIDKVTNERFSLIKKLLCLKSYQRITNEAEYELIKYAMSENMSQAGKHAIPSIIISRSTISKLIHKLNGSIDEKILKNKHTPETLYIEMDEIHANLQHGGNKICPCAIVHEGHESEISKRKKLKNVHYFATAKYTYENLYDEIYDYINKKYDIDKIKHIFISGDGAVGIKSFDTNFPNAIFVLDKFHCIKYLKKIFKSSNKLNIAFSYLKNGNIETFNGLVANEIELNPENAKTINESKKYLLNNIDGIKNQSHNEYKCPCSMESHVNHGFARYITSSPYGFSLTGLENKLKLLVYNANKIELTYEDYLNLKNGENKFEILDKTLYALDNLDFKYSNLLKNKTTKPSGVHECYLPKFNNEIVKNFFQWLISIKNF